jgi:Glycosyltransferase family 87
VFGPTRGFDFAGFYTAGRILNAWPPQRLYDLDLQDRVFHELLPGLPPETKLPYVYPPFFSLLFRPPALLPYAWACLTWMLLSAGLYLGGLALIWHGVEAIAARERSTALLLALSFQPFAECWLSGQASTVGFVAMALALHCEARGRPFGAGLCLALCLYKPPLLVLVLPMLVIARRSRVLLGFVAGAMALAVVSVLAVGWRGCVAYVHHITAFSRLMRSPTTEFPTWKFIDLDHFLGSMFDGHDLLRSSALVMAALAVLPVLIRSWWPLDRHGPERRLLTWSATLTWTLVLNVYIGVYDAILIVPGLVITADAHWRRDGMTARVPAPAFKFLLALLFMVPWVSQHLARSLGFQPFTLVLMGLGAYQLALAGRDVVGEEMDRQRRFRQATALGVIP